MYYRFLINKPFATLCAVALFTYISPSIATAKAKNQTDQLILDKIIISATKTKHTLGDVPVDAEVITHEELEKRQVKTVQEALKYLPGIKISETSSSWGDKGKIQIQGLDERHTLILVDGQRYLGGHGDAADLQSIPLDMVERIEVVKGPASALYGSDALGGVVNIITKSAPKKYSLSLSPSFGTRATQIHETTAGFGAGGFSSLLGYTYRESNGVKKETDEYHEHLFQGSLGYSFTPDSQLTVKPFFSEHFMEYESRRQKRGGVNSLWDWAPDEVSNLKLRGSYFNYQHTTGNRNSDWETDSYEGEFTYNRMVFNRHMLSAGYQFFKEEITDHGKGYEADQDLHSFYIQDEIDIHPLVIVLGTRVDCHDRWGTEVNPKLSLLYAVTDKFKIRASVGTAFKGPSLVKLYGDLWRMGPYVVYSNPNLDPEKSIGYQLSFEYAFSERFLAKLALFKNDIDDLIDSYTVRRGKPPFGMYWRNIDEAITQGAELSLTARVTQGLTARAGYNYLDTEDKNLHRELTYRSRHKTFLELNQRFAEIGLDLNFAAEYRGWRYDDDYEQLGGYFICNLAATKDIGDHFQIFAKADNILNKRNMMQSRKKLTRLEA
ncbi:TonB-dependent receptor plug domain-containing protein [Trichloromonas sp.]|uniref:TonB-dependent receptor plug domain-containing protein n=1 Tax=Trichloromonas sp. TaxID=3069249 RepID=UPI002A452002|nr:TonB-dependent receptor [Trichloromonas sp.]